MGPIGAIADSPAVIDESSGREFYPERSQNIVIYCLDSAPYWRSSIHPEYKAGRPKKSDLHRLIRQSMKDHCVTLSQEGFEADDLIAYMCLQFANRSPGSSLDQAYILTGDGDLMGLVTDEVTWLNLRGGENRQRGPRDCYQWLTGKYAKQAKRRHQYWPMPSQADFHPSDIWKWKYTVAGDPSDNLKFPAPNSHPYEDLVQRYRGLIDLYRPAVRLPEDPSWTAEALQRAIAWRPQWHYDDLVMESVSEFGVQFPIAPLSLVL
jgi:hypothetical protein